MEKNAEVRRGRQEDLEGIIRVATDVREEILGHLTSKTGKKVSRPSPTWRNSWVVVADGEVVGVGILKEDYIDDLWIFGEYRGQRVGERLLSKLEEDIKTSGHVSGRLRVVAENARARRFYARHGWRETRLYPHERHGYLMVDLHKDLRANS